VRYLGERSHSSLSSLLDLLLGGSGGSLGGGLGHLGFLGLLGGNDFLLAGLNFGGSGGEGGISVGSGLSTLSLDLVKRHTYDGLADLDVLTSVSSLVVIASDLLVLASPGHGPSEVDGLSSLVEHASGLVGDEVGKGGVLGDESATNSGVDLESRE
jgi:hypothetical protein